MPNYNSEQFQPVSVKSTQPRHFISARLPAAAGGAYRAVRDSPSQFSSSEGGGGVLGGGGGGGGRFGSGSPGSRQTDSPGAR